MKLNNYNNNSLIANCELDNIKLTQDFADKMYKAILPNWSSQVTICTGGAVDTSYTTPSNGYINVFRQELDEKGALNMWFNERQVLGVDNPTTYYRGTSAPLLRIKKGVTVKVQGGNSNCVIEVRFIPLRGVSA